MADDEPREHDWAGPRPLRIATIVSFAPAFPLCLAHGVISSAPAPAVGLVPLAASAAAGVVLLQNKTRRHPGIILAADAVLAAALMVVLVFTWMAGPRDAWNAGLSMLAAYATMPLLVNFLIHLSLSLRAVYIGLALDSLVQWLAWQCVPPDCPECNHRLRPPLPSFPWFRRRDGEYEPLLVSDEESRFRDDGGEASRPEQPAVEDIVSKKARKGKGSPAAAAAEDSVEW